MKDKILITGAGGFIGRYVIKKLKDNNIDYIGIDYKEDLENNIKNISILDDEALNNLFKEYKPTRVLHLAAIANVMYENVGELYDVNIRGTENILKAIDKINENKKIRFVLASTAGVYGNQDKEVYTEDLPYNPENHYSYSKMVAEMIARKYIDIDTVVIRPFNIIGVGQNENFLIPKVVKSFANREPELRLGNLKPQRDYVGINYCVDVILELLTKVNLEYNVYNICRGKGTSVEEVLDLLREYSNHNPNIMVDPKFVRKNEVWKLVGDPTRVESLFKDKDYKREKFADIIKSMYDEYGDRKYD